MRPAMSILLSILSVASLSGCTSYHTIQEATADQERVADDVKLLTADDQGSDSGKGPLPYLKALHHPPKRVALVSFNVQSPVHNGSDKYTVLTAAGAQQIADGLYHASVAVLKKDFHKNGMTLLEPSEFLTDSAKKQAYKSFEVDISGGAALVGGVFDAMKNGHLDEGAAAAKSYRIIHVMGVVAPFASVTDSIGGDLAKSLGVDAVLIVNNVCQYDGRRVFLNTVELMLFGPNPIPLPDDELGGFTDGRKGHLYAAASVQNGFLKNVVILPADNTELTGLENKSNYAGYDRIVNALASKVGSTVQTLTTEK